MTSVLIGQSYFLRFDPKLHAAMQPYPPLGALYAAAVLRGRGHDVSFFDAMLAESEVGQRVTPDLANADLAHDLERLSPSVGRDRAMRAYDGIDDLLDRCRLRGSASCLSRRCRRG